MEFKFSFIIEGVSLIGIKKNMQKNIDHKKKS